MRIDEKTRQIWFTANGREAGRDPYFQHLYRIGFDGKGLTLLTPEDANHTVTLSPDGKYFIDTYSTPDTPPVTVLRDGAGKVVQPLEQADISRAGGLRAGAADPGAGEGARRQDRHLRPDVHAVAISIRRKKYPIINHIYPGPQSGSVGPRSFIPARGDNQALAELGFVVVEIDGMGTPGRSKAFHDFVLRPHGRQHHPRPGRGDEGAGARAIAFIDIDKVGIWGHSGGGFATAAAMFRLPRLLQGRDRRVRATTTTATTRTTGASATRGCWSRSGDTDNYAAEANQTHAEEPARASCS